MKTFHVGLIGGGVISRAHIAAAQASGGRVRITAIADPAEPAHRAIADATGAAPFASAEQMFAAAADASLPLDGVLVCTPPSVRVPVVKMALERGIAVLVEKPLAHHVSDAKTLVELAEAYPKVTTAVGYCHRFVPAILEMQRMHRAGELGTVVRFENTFACWFPQMAQRWMSDVRVSGGGALIDTGSHSLDLFRFLLGQGKVVGASFRHEWEGRGDSNATVLVQGGSSAGVIASGWAEPARFVVSLVGTRAMASYDYDRPQELHIKPSQGEAQIVAVETHEVRFERQLLTFAEVASGRADRGGLASFEDGLAVAQMVAEAEQLASII